MYEELLAGGKRALLEEWEACGQPKICLAGKDTRELHTLATLAAFHGLPFFMVHDAGRTQVAAGSLTVLAVGPAAKGEVNIVTGQLKLL
jgi:peptidyl-tRNA hydrolase, PTH2 family